MNDRMSRSNLAGALIDYNQEANKNIFKYAIETANKEILNDEGFQLKGIVKEISYGNDFEASKSACKLLRVCSIMCMKSRSISMFFRISQIKIKTNSKA